jgi:hypothetical protein
MRKAVAGLAGELVPVPDDRGILPFGPAPQVGPLTCGVLGSARYPDADCDVLAHVASPVFVVNPRGG